MEENTPHLELTPPPYRSCMEENTPHLELNPLYTPGAEPTPMKKKVCGPEDCQTTAACWRPTVLPWHAVGLPRPHGRWSGRRALLRPRAGRTGPGPCAMPWHGRVCAGGSVSRRRVCDWKVCVCVCVCKPKVVGTPLGRACTSLMQRFTCTQVPQKPAATCAAGASRTGIGANGHTEHGKKRQLAHTPRGKEAEPVLAGVAQAITGSLSLAQDTAHVYMH